MLHRRVKVDLLMCYKILHNYYYNYLNCDDFSHALLLILQDNTMKVAMLHILSARGALFPGRVKLRLHQDQGNMLPGNMLPGRATFAVNIYRRRIGNRTQAFK